MPRRCLLTPAERASLLAFPTSDDELIQHYTFTEPDLSAIRQRRGNPNRLGFAVQLCYLRYPGLALPPEGEPPPALLSYAARQLGVDVSLWTQYAQRSSTRREHLAELQAWLNLRPFGLSDYRRFVGLLSELAQQTDRGLVLAYAFVEAVRQQRVMMPGVEVIERACAEALTRGTRQVHEALTSSLSDHQRQALDKMLAVREGTSVSGLTWLRQPPGVPNAKHVLNHIERLKAICAMELPDGLERTVHQNRLLKLAREGGQMTAQHLRDFEDRRRYATLVALILDARATLTDEIIDLNDRIIGTLFSRAKRLHAERFQQSGKAVNDKVRLYSRIGRALLNAKQSGGDPFAAIEAILPWDVFTQSVTQAEALAQSADFDFLPLIGDGFTQLRRYTPALLETLQLTAAPAAYDLLAGVETLKEMNRCQARKVPESASTSFVRRRWEKVVYTNEGLDRRFYELCVLSQLKNALRSGDIWVRGSRQFKDFEEYLLPSARFSAQREQQELGLAVDTDCERFLKDRLALLERELGTVERLALQNELPDAAITNSGLKVTPLTNAVPAEAETLMRQVSALMPHLKITELLLEVDSWTDFTRHFTHLKSDESATDKSLLRTSATKPTQRLWPIWSMLNSNSRFPFGGAKGPLHPRTVSGSARVAWDEPRAT